MEILFQFDKHSCTMKRHISKGFCCYKNAVFHCQQLLIVEFLCGPQSVPKSFQIWEIPLQGTNSKPFSCLNQN